MIPLLESPESLTAFGDSRADVDTAMDLLANRRRRAMLDALEANDGSATLTELAVEIAAQEAGSEPNAISDHGDVSAREQRAVRISLHHTHIPKLSAAEAIDYDSATETVALRDRGRALLSRKEGVHGAPQESR